VNDAGADARHLRAEQLLDGLLDLQLVRARATSNTIGAAILADDRGSSP
jgi:hypothetical protein